MVRFGVGAPIAVAGPATDDDVAGGGLAVDAVAMVIGRAASAALVSPVHDDPAVAALVAVANTDGHDEVMVGQVPLSLVVPVDLLLGSHVHELLVVQQLPLKAPVNLDGRHQLAVHRDLEQSGGAGASDESSSAQRHHILGVVRCGLSGAAREESEHLVREALVPIRMLVDPEERGIGSGLVADS